MSGRIRPDSELNKGRMGVVGWAFALALAFILASAMFPAIAEAPAQVTIKPLASCAKGTCTMPQKDFETLQKFHADRIAAILEAGALIAQLQQENQDLMRLLARDAAGCKGRRT